MNRSIILSVAAVVLMAASLQAEETLPLKSVNKANEVIDAALEAHGGADNLTKLNSLVQKSRFVNYANGQSRKPGPPWDKGEQESFNAIDFERGMFVTRNAGFGGGYEFDGDVPLDESYLNSFREHALNAGLRPSQANEMMNFVRGTIERMNEGMSQGAEEARYAAEQELRQEFGQAFEQRLELAQMAAQNLLGGTEMFDNIQLSDGRMLGDHPDIIRMFSNLASQIGEDNLAGETTELIMTPEEASRQIAEMTRRDGPYFDRMHPEHETYVAEVLRLREYM